VYEVTGKIVFVLLACGVAALSLAVLAAVIDAKIEKWRDRTRWEKAREVGNDLLTASWWFGEADEEPARRVLKVLGAQLSQYGNFDNDRMRQEFRLKEKP
jgi:hypothetical protein